MMTCSACDMRKAASSALPRFHGRSIAASPPLAPALSPPKPPAITLMKLRFIARHMMYDRIAPDEPTSAPVMLIPEIGRAHVCTPVTNAHLVCRLLLEKKKHHN